MKSEIKSVYISECCRSKIDDLCPRLSVEALIEEIVKNCFDARYMFRNPTMENRHTKHGALPKSFFRESFIRSSKLRKLADTIYLDLDDLVDIAISSVYLKEVIMYDRKAEKVFYKFDREAKHGGC